MYFLKLQLSLENFVPKIFYPSQCSFGSDMYNNQSARRPVRMSERISVLSLNIFRSEKCFQLKLSRAVFINRRAEARYRALASIIWGREKPRETTICYKISLVELITNLNVVLYLSTCHTINISVLILFMIMP